MEKFYTEHKGRVINKDNKFSHVMAITLDPRTQYKEGIIRCITSRDGDIQTKGYVDRSELHKIKGGSLENFEIGEKLNIKNETNIISNLTKEGCDFIGLEDPDRYSRAEDARKLYVKFKEKNKDVRFILVNGGHTVLYNKTKEIVFLLKKELSDSINICH